MSFFYQGIEITKPLTERQRETLNIVEFTKPDHKGRQCRYVRVTYYDEERKCTRAAVSRKIGELDEHGNLIPVMRKRSGVRKAEDGLSELAQKAENTLSDERQDGKVRYGIPVVLGTAVLAALAGKIGSTKLRLYWEVQTEPLKKLWGTDFPKETPSIPTLNRMFQLIKPKQFHEFYQDYVFPFLPRVSEDRKTVVCVDG